MSHKSSMHGGGESSDCIVPAKCANKGGEPSAERMEGRRSAKEILEYWADAGHRARQYRQLQYVGSACGPGTGRACLSPRWEPCALEARARVCAGGGGQSSSLPRPAALPGGVRRIACPERSKAHFVRRNDISSSYALGSEAYFATSFRSSGVCAVSTACFCPPDMSASSCGTCPRSHLESRKAMRIWSPVTRTRAN